jgi:hypothetical protein
MTDHVYKLVHLVGSSQESLQGAMENAVARANKTVQ